MDFPVEVTVEHTTEILRGKEYPLKITRTKGLHMMMVGGREVLCEKSTVSEGHYGTTVVVTRARYGPPDPKGVERILSVAREVILRQGLA